MPAVVDKQAERLRILDAFQECIGEKPFDKITIRDIAAKAKTPHPTVLTYFKNRNDIVVAYIDHLATQSVERAIDWVKTHSAAEFDSKKQYLKKILYHAAKFDNASRKTYTGAMNAYILAQYEPEVSGKLQKIFSSWLSTLQNMLEKELGIKKMAAAKTGFFLSCLEGICLCTYNGLFDAEAFDQILDLMADVFIGYGEA